MQFLYKLGGYVHDWSCPPDKLSSQGDRYKYNKKFSSNNLNDIKSCAGPSNNLKMLKTALEDTFKMLDVLEGGHLDGEDVKNHGVLISAQGSTT